MTKRINSEKQQWLLEESRSWVESDIISAEQSRSIQSLYQLDNEVVASTNWAMGILVAIGALLIGGGIILLFAYNWEFLGKGARTVLSFLPLLIAQALCLYTYKSKFESAAWREAGATLLFTGIAASIGLIGQTYHIYGDLERFVLVWFVLGLPIVYLMRSGMVMILLTGLVCWLSTFQGKTYWLLFLTLLPYWIYCYRHQRNMVFYWGVWLSAIGLAVSLLISSWYRDSPISIYPVTILLTISSAYYLLGKILFGFDNYQFWKNPLSSLGAVGIGVFTLIMSFWGEAFGFRNFWYDNVSIDFAFVMDALVFFSALSLILFGLVRYQKILHFYQMLMIGAGLTGLFALLHFSHAITKIEWIPWFFNLYVAVTASAVIVSSAEHGRTLSLNGGLIWLSLLILVRFFDSDISILWKAIAFIVIGFAFISVNIWFSRKQKQITDKAVANG